MREKEREGEGGYRRASSTRTVVRLVRSHPRIRVARAPVVLNRVAAADARRLIIPLAPVLPVAGHGPRACDERPCLTKHVPLEITIANV